MSENIENQQDVQLKNAKFAYIKQEDFVNTVLKHPNLMMIWGDIGTGKTTLALQFVEKILRTTEKKVFYLHSKQSPIQDLIKRIVFQKMNSNRQKFLFWEITKFKQQFEIILQWQLQIKQLSQVFKVEQVGLVVVDEIASQYLLQFGSDIKNEQLNQLLTTIMATLKKICKEFHIPVIILNGFTTKKEEKEDKFEAKPFGGKIIDFWTDFEIKLERTSQVSRRKLSVVKNKDDIPVPSSWTWVINEHGFN
jgi:RecA/RadA recombinase